MSERSFERRDVLKLAGGSAVGVSLATQSATAGTDGTETTPEESSLRDAVAYGPDDEPITLSLMHDPSSVVQPDIAAQIQSDLEKIGVGVELLETSDILSEFSSEPLEDVDDGDLPPWAPRGRNAGPPELTRTVNGWDLLIGIAGNSRPRNPLATESFWDPRGVVNVSGYTDEEIEQLYDDANDTLDREERVEIISEIFGQLTTEAAANFLSEDEDFTAFRPDINTGEAFNTVGYEPRHQRYRGDERTVGGDYVVLTTSNPQTFYPPEADDASSTAVIDEVADIAYGLTADNEQVPQTLKIEDSGNSEVWVCTVRDNIQFGEGVDGEDFGHCTAEDWVYQIENVYDVAEGDHGWDEESPPSNYVSEWDVVDNVKQTGTYEFQIELPSPDPDFFLRPLLRNRYILPQALYEKYFPNAEALRQSDEVAEFTWTGNLGPYTLEDNVPGPAGKVTFDRNDEYYMRGHTEESNVQVMDDAYADVPYFETREHDREEAVPTINNRWRDGDGDEVGLISTLVVEEFQEREDTRVENTLGPFISTMFINQRANAHPLLREREGRFAICQVIDKIAITEDIQNGLSGPPAVTWQPSWSEFYDEDELVEHGLDIDEETIQNARDTIDDLDGFTVVEPEPLPGSDDPPQDLNGNGLFEDVQGDGDVTVIDVQALFENLDDELVQDNSPAFNFSGLDHNEVTIFDVQALFNTIGEFED